jgi:formylmethanofuran dehydrogenase subunit B
MHMSELNRATCPFCSLHCAGLHLSFHGDQLQAFEPGCALGATGFQHAAFDLSARDPSQKSTLDSLCMARAWLEEARQPLVVLSGDLDSESVEAALQLARKYTAILTCEEDWSGSLLDLSAKAGGLLSGTLGDLQILSLVILCGVAPAQTHPRLGDFLKRDLESCTLRIEPAWLLEGLRWLRLAGQGQIEDLLQVYSGLFVQVEAAPSGLVVFGPDLLAMGWAFMTEFLLWLRDLNRRKPWYALYLPPASNSTGVVDMLMARTGFPGNLRFTSRGTDCSPRLWQAEQVINRGWADLCLLAGLPVSFSEETLHHLSQGRTILLGSDRPAWGAPIWLPAARAGVDSIGQVQRLDGVPVLLHACLPGKRQPMKELLLELAGEESPA